MKTLLSLLCFFIFTVSYSAIAQSHKGITFQGVIKLPNETYPTLSGLTVNAKVLSPTNCILREESFTNVSITNGYINLVVGGGTRTGHDPNLSFGQIMDNSATISSLVCLDGSGHVTGTTSYDPTSGNGARKFRLSIASLGITADFNMRAVPFAINAETLAGKNENDFIKVTAGVTQNVLENLIANTDLQDLLAGTYSAPVSGTVGVGNGGTGATTKTAAFNNLSPLTTKGDIITHNGTDNIRLGVGADNRVLTADSSTASGLAWKPIAAGGDISNGGNTFGAAATIGTTDAFALNLATHNSNRMAILSTGQIEFNNQLRAPNGSQAAPGYSFKNSTSTGFFLEGSDDVISISINGAQIAGITNDKFGSYRRFAMFEGNQGASDPAYAFDGDPDTGMFWESANVLGFATGGAKRVEIAANGNMTVTGQFTCILGNASGGVSCASDQRLKENIKPLENPLDRILALRGVEYDWNKKAGNSAGKHSMGVIAQEVEKQFPLAVQTNEKSGLKSVDYSVLTAPLIEALKAFYAQWFTDSQKLHQELEIKEKKIQELENRLNSIEKFLKQNQATIDAAGS